jgi:hypothetical protein
MSDDPKGLSRRDFLRRATTVSLAATFGLPALARAAAAAATATPGAAAAPAAGTAVARAAGAAVQGKAKAVIQIWLWGGPSHLDTFDPKPDAGYDYAGPLNHPISTNVPGMQICELLPLLAKQGDKYSLLRSVAHGNFGHETAAYLTQTGHEPGGTLVYPTIGAVVGLFKGYDHGYKGLVPPYVVITQPQGRFSECGFLGPIYKPFATGGNPAAKRFEVEGISSQGITDERQVDRRALMHNLDALGKADPSDPSFAAYDSAEEKAYDFVRDAAKIFDLAEEKQDLRTIYGQNTFGQSCLAARRLVERGVPYITINHGGWDTHKRHFEAMRQKLPELDKGLSTLLTDLSDRGLLDSTIIWCCGEFGRTPRIDWAPPWDGGRGHYGNCFSVLVAGGGFQGGHVVGTSDAKGEFPATRPVHVQDLIGSIYELLGIDPDGALPNPRGLDLKVMPSEENGPGKGRLHEIM